MLMFNIKPRARYFPKGRTMMTDWLIEVFPLIISIAVYAVGLVIFFENRSPHRTLYWLLVLAFLPVIGLLFYLFFGRSSSRYKFFWKMGHHDIPYLKKRLEKSRGSVDYLLNNTVSLHEKKRLSRIISATSPSFVTFNNQCRVLNNGREKFPAIFEAIKNAKHHIHLEYFIVQNDEVGNDLKKLLMEKASRGVKVRFLYDGLGSRKLGRRYLNSLHKSKVETAAFMPLTLPVPSTWMNYRNHRKILIVDGEIGFLGGINIGEEYIDGGKRFPSWRDVHLEIRGDALDILQGVFISDWQFTTGKIIEEEGCFPHRDPIGNKAVQIAASGPDGNWEAIHHAYFTAIATARETIYITTPYLILDDSISTALKAAALGGVDVKIVFPGKPDHRIVYWASYSYFADLLRAGVKIYLYQKGFIHAKTLTVDSQVTVIGTANMDMRSFYYSFEINAFIYDEEITQQLERTFEEDLSNSVAVDFEEYLKRPIYVKFKESGARLLSPLL